MNEPTASGDDTDALSPARSILNEMLKEANPAERPEIELGLWALLDELGEDDPVDRNLVDRIIERIDHRLEAQVNVIVHDAAFQQLESVWLSVEQLVRRLEGLGTDGVIVDIVNASRADLQDDAEANADKPEASDLFEKLAVEPMTRATSSPYSLTIVDESFGPGEDDVALLTHLGSVGRLAGCPVILQVDNEFFAPTNLDELTRKKNPLDPRKLFESTRFTGFRDFCATQAAQYLGATLPRFLLRRPYGDQSRVRGFRDFEEDCTESVEGSPFLWGNSAFALAAVAAQSFAKHGWLEDVCGRTTGGKFERLAILADAVEDEDLPHVPTEFWITEASEKRWSDLGFIPLVCFENQDFAVFFAASSLFRPASATSHSPASSNLAYFALVERFAHYARSLLRDDPAGAVSADSIHTLIANWLNEYRGDDLPATPRPLQNCQCTVKEMTDAPGNWQIKISIQPQRRLAPGDIWLHAEFNWPIRRTKS